MHVSYDSVAFPSVPSCVWLNAIQAAARFERGRCSVYASGMSQGLQLDAEERDCAEPGVMPASRVWQRYRF
jgi:hypothetical protein